MADNTPKSSSKIQFEGQQYARHAAIPDDTEIVYPNKFQLNSIKSASVFEIVGGALFLFFGVILISRLFFIADENKTQADRVGFFIIYGILAIFAVAAASFLISRLIKIFRENKIYILPNGFPINIHTVLNDYQDAHAQLFERLGYYDVHYKRAENPMVAPGEITYTYSPSDTYAPSNMPREQKADNEVLGEMLSIEPEEAVSELPSHVNFFDYIDAREPGHIIIGISEQNELIQVPIQRMFNHLVGGAIGTGKSVYLRSLVYQFMVEADKSDIILGLADIENNTFPEFKDCRHVQWYASNYLEIERLTATLLKEVERRKLLYESLASTPKDIERYNVLARREGIDELPSIVIIYDEFSALMHRSQTQQKHILANILQLALRSRKYGIFLVIAGQTFKSDLIDSSVLGQFNFSIAFKVRSVAASMSLLGQPGAEKLRQPGESLVKARDGTIQHIQCLHIDDDELLDQLHEFKDQESEHIPQLVYEIAEFAHTKLGDKVRFRDLETYMNERGISRGELMKQLAWMEEHKFILRGNKNARILNWKAIEKQ